MMPLVFGLPAGAEWILIVLAFLLIFGGSRIAGLGKGSGRAIREFREELRAGEENKPVASQPSPADPVESKAPVSDPTDPR